MSYLDELKKLKDLLDDGAITSYEFEEEKEKILAMSRSSMGDGTSAPIRDNSSHKAYAHAVRLSDNGDGGMTNLKTGDGYITSPNAIFLKNWRTNGGLTFLGIAINVILDRFVLGNINVYSISYEAIIFTQVMLYIYMIIGIIYATVIYPSLFTDNPKAQSPNTISFLNGFFGYVIFALLWNRSLTKGMKGISHIVYIVIIVVMMIIYLLI